MPNGRFCAAKKYFVCFVCNDVTICVLLCAREFTVCSTITDGGRHGYTLHCTSQGFSSLLFALIAMQAPVPLAAQDSLPRELATLPCAGLISNPCTTPWRCETQQILLQDGIDCLVEVHYCRRECQGQVEFYIDWKQTHLIGGCEGWDTWTFFHRQNQSALEWLVLTLIHLDTLNGGWYNTPPCPDGNFFVNLYTAACGIWVGCEYKIDRSYDKQCDQGLDPPDLEYERPPGSGNWYIRSSRWQSCGQTCCLRRYKLCTKQYVDRVSGYEIHLIEKVRLGQCTEQQKYGNKPCEDGC